MKGIGSLYTCSMKEAVGKKQAASWFPAQFLCPKLAQDIGEPASDFAFLILNQPILNKGYFLTLWRNGKRTNSPIELKQLTN